MFLQNVLTKVVTHKVETFRNFILNSTITKHYYSNECASNLKFKFTKGIYLRVFQQPIMLFAKSKITP